jgi:hypothetical protein
MILAILFRFFGILALKDLSIWLSNTFALSIPHEGYPINPSYALYTPRLTFNNNQSYKIPQKPPVRP